METGLFPKPEDLRPDVDLVIPPGINIPEELLDFLSQVGVGYTIHVHEGSPPSLVTDKGVYPLESALTTLCAEFAYQQP